MSGGDAIAEMGKDKVKAGRKERTRCRLLVNIALLIGHVELNKL